MFVRKKLLKCSTKHLPVWFCRSSDNIYVQILILILMSMTQVWMHRISCIRPDTVSGQYAAVFLKIILHRCQTFPNIGDWKFAIYFFEKYTKITNVKMFFPQCFGARSARICIKNGRPDLDPPGRCGSRLLLRGKINKKLPVLVPHDNLHVFIILLLDSKFYLFFEFIFKE